MSPNTFILTNSPFIKDQVALASFVPNVRQPHQDAEKPYIVGHGDYSIQPDDCYEGLISVTSESFLNIVATKFANLKFASEKNEMTSVSAKKGYLYTLNHPVALFDYILFGTKGSKNYEAMAEEDRTREYIKKWLESYKRRGLEPRFVVGYRTFINARLSVAQDSNISLSGKGTAPLSTAHGDPTGAGDLSVDTGHKATTEMKDAMKTPGERIYAICYRKIKIERYKDDFRPSLDQVNKWKSFYVTRGKVSYVQADMLEMDDQENCEIQSMRTGSGGMVFFGILNDMSGGERENDEETELEGD